MQIMRIANKIIESDKLIYQDLSYQVNGILFTIHNEIGRYGNEKQYCDAIEAKLIQANIKYGREKEIPKSFTGELRGRNKVDFIIEDKIILEIKAKRLIARDEYYQSRRYLDAFNKKLCILVNFRDRYLKPKRILNSSVSA